MQGPKKPHLHMPCHVMHELDGQLSIILLSCGALRRMLNQTVSENQLRELDSIELSAAKIHDLTKQLRGTRRLDERVKIAAKKAAKPEHSVFS